MEINLGDYKGPAKGEDWVDDQGYTLPPHRITKEEKFRQRKAEAILKKSASLIGQIKKTKQYIADICQEYWDKFVEEDDGLGTLSFTDFAKKIKITRVVDSKFDYDDEKVAECEERFKTFLNNISGEGLSEKAFKDLDMLKRMVISGFTKKRGQYDPKKLEDLSKFQDISSDETINEMLEDLKAARVRGGIRVYYHVYLMSEDEEGKPKWDRVDFSFSSTEINDPYLNQKKQ